MSAVAHICQYAWSLHLVNINNPQPDDGFYLLHQILSMLWLYIAMSCPQMRGNLIGYRGESTNPAHEKAVCRENNVGMNGTA
jgi:gamma-glutamyl:cysteine ligase YbdK (ATP-grasp superfamily)